MDSTNPGFDKFGGKKNLRTLWQEWKYQLTVMLLELNNGLATLQKNMSKMLDGFLSTMVLDYLNEIIIYSPNYEEHMYHLRQILEQLQKWSN